ncbi:Uma2 family endonuclease [Nocardia mexicana]|uniref:Uma2 family endonuclease n=1 Tax=Nocardia mexicana TaxID=279262 RepID=A0A370GQZ8_9NOCA|nr:Uma2 family endonuclease [Nocardia mexicana]RDI46145.1 Uma2 family endonuclease [Nocardia mexicana]
MSAAIDFSSSFGVGPYTAEDLHNSPEEGKGSELWNGWLIEKMSPSLRHNRMSRGLRCLFVDAARRAGADVLVDGGEYEFAFPNGIRKPDVFVIDSKAEETGFAEEETFLDPADLLLIVEVVSPRSGSEAHDRTVKRIEYASAGVPSYWIVDFRPVPRIEALHLDGGRYVRTAVATADETLVVEHPFEISVTPNALYDLGRRDFA